MKKVLSALLILSVIAGQAQNSDQKKQPTLMASFSLTDFKTAQAIRSSSLSSVLTNNKWSKSASMDAGFGLAYLQGLSNHMDLMVTLNATSTKYPFRNKTAYSNSYMLVELDGAVNMKLLTDKHFAVPYLTAGLGISKFKNVWGAYMPIGAGVQLKLAEGTFALANFQYRVAASTESNYHFFYSVGIGSALFEKKK